MRIGQLAQRAEVSRDTIRFYERNGLIASNPGTSTSNSYREYSDDSVIQLSLIKEAQAAGFTIAELYLFINELNEGNSDEFDAMEFLQIKIRDIEANIKQQKKFLVTLKATLNALDMGK